MLPYVNTGKGQENDSSHPSQEKRQRRMGTTGLGWHIALGERASNYCRVPLFRDVKVVLIPDHRADER